MNPADDWQLVDEYAATGSHEAFNTLVRRHAGWIYATARRRVKSADLADDVTQAAFIVLARKARSIKRRESLSAWLYRVANYAAIDALRRQEARRKHERSAAKPEAIVPTDDQNDAVAQHLDMALDSLNGRDREAIILRYFNDQTLEQIGHAQRVAASTVQRRLERSLAQIGYRLKRNGVVTAPASIGVILAAVGTCSAPSSATAGLTALASATAAMPANIAGPIGLAKGTIKTMTMLKLKAAALLALGSAGTLIILGAGSFVLAHSHLAAQPVMHTAEQAAPIAATPAAGGGGDLMGQFSADWQSAELMVVHLNPQALRNKGQAADDQSVSISATITIGDAKNILGLDRSNFLKVTRIMDETGRDMTSLAAVNTQTNHWYMPLQYSQNFNTTSQHWEESLRPQQFNVGLKLGSRLPNRLVLVEGYLNALTFDHSENVDVPFVVNGPPVTVLGQKLRFTSITMNGDNFGYQLRSDAPVDAPGFDGRIGDGNELPQRMVAARYFIDSAGKSVGAESHPFGNFDTVGSLDGSGGADGGDKVTAMRYEIASGLHERRVRVSIKNIDLPHLSVATQTLPMKPAALSPLEQTGQSLARRLQEERDHAPGNGWNDAMDQHVRDLWKAYAADWNTGTSMKIVAAEVMGLVPDTTSYDQYVGSYRFTTPQITVQQEGESPTTLPTAPQNMVLTIQKDAQARLTLVLAGGQNVPLAGRNGALFGVTDPLFVNGDPLDPKSPPKLAGLWVVRSGGHLMLLMDIGRPMMPIELEPVALTTHP